VFVVNRSQTDSLVVDLNWQDVGHKAIHAVYQLAGNDPKAANSFENPDLLKTVKVAAPALDGKTTTLKLPPLSFTAVEMT
jgi:alpha-N-arabinofuranosidase